MLMSTNGKKNENEVKLNQASSDNYSPEIETSIWYN